MRALSIFRTPVSRRAQKPPELGPDADNQPVECARSARSRNASHQAIHCVCARFIARHLSDGNRFYFHGVLHWKLIDDAATVAIRHAFFRRVFRGTVLCRSRGSFRSDKRDLPSRSSSCFFPRKWNRGKLLSRTPATALHGQHLHAPYPFPIEIVGTAPLNPLKAFRFVERVKTNLFERAVHFCHPCFRTGLYGRNRQTGSDRPRSVSRLFVANSHKAVAFVRSINTL